VALLESDPAGFPDAIYDSGSDQRSAPIGDHGLMLYAVMNEPATVIVLRLIAF
jgi:hypothetical protein